MGHRTDPFMGSSGDPCMGHPTLGYSISALSYVTLPSPYLVALGDLRPYASSFQDKKKRHSPTQGKLYRLSLSTRLYAHHSIA